MNAEAGVDEDVIYSADQIEVPAELPNFLKEYAKAIIRENPTKGTTDAEQAKKQIYKWSLSYFSKKIEGTNREQQINTDEANSGNSGIQDELQIKEFSEKA